MVLLKSKNEYELRTKVEIISELTVVMNALLYILRGSIIYLGLLHTEQKITSYNTFNSLTDWKSRLFLT